MGVKPQMITNPKTLHHPTLGTVHITERANARNIIMRWKQETVHVTVRHGCPTEAISEAIERNIHRLEAARPSTVRFSIGQTLSLDGFSFRIEQSPQSSPRLSATFSNDEALILVGKDVDMDSTELTKSISHLMLDIAHKVAWHHLSPIARGISDRLGMTPSGWKIVRGTRKLGHCDSRRVIALSSALIFLPEEIRQYIICHEIAHLTQMNHSPRFHALCDTYCHTILKQSAAGIEARLRKYRWPILR